MSTPTSAVISVVICAFLAYLAWRWRVFDAKVTAGAFLIGVVIGVAGSLLWLLILVAFLAVSFVATLHGMERKREMGLQEGTSGERSLKNIVANGAVPVFISVLHAAGILDLSTGTVLFGSAVATATSDTLASEIGVLEGRAYLITTMKRVSPGTDGGISARGEAGSALGAVIIGLLVYAALLLMGRPSAMSAAAVAVAGFVGCQIDSVLGATLESRGLIGKGGVNFLSIAAATLLTFIFLSLI